ncbi:MAG: hypothetical protein HY900_10320 [Deltaproteobacteria bacterium]|nr:hypothetical protein [Deltaproteobacteria bacterium]
MESFFKVVRMAVVIGLLGAPSVLFAQGEGEGPEMEMEDEEMLTPEENVMMFAVLEDRLAGGVHVAHASAGTTEPAATVSPWDHPSRFYDA